ncbi:hypothetical protein scyTo_0010959 [Scyliorhinus torazame]|uniref:Uncharacterized protein n=2 Tax=Scyliorhinus torazame TaxID=75743 RepID=A0A401PDL1_SCYTO|nr:hypothetical protein [Scyliorhinus torazame]
MEMKPLQRMESYVQDTFSEKHHSNLSSKNTMEDYHPDFLSYGVQRLKRTTQNTENFRPMPPSEPNVQRLETLRMNVKLEPRPSRHDISMSPNLKTVTVPQCEEEMMVQYKSNSGSNPILVAMVILLNISVAILFVHFFI